MKRLYHYTARWAAALASITVIAMFTGCEPENDDLFGPERNGQERETEPAQQEQAPPADPVY